jgi:hypothetical protein
MQELLDWARVGYGPFSLCVIHKEGLFSSSGDINRLVMIKKTEKFFQMLPIFYYVSK